MIASLCALTLAYSLVLTLAGGLAISFEQQRRWGVLSAALGLLLGYPLALFLIVFLPPPAAFGCVLALLCWLAVRSLRRMEPVRQRLMIAVRNATLLSATAVLFWLPGAIGPRKGLFSEASGDFTIYAGLPAKSGPVKLWKAEDFRTLLTKGGMHFSVSPPLSFQTKPPQPGWSVQSIIELRWHLMYTGWFALQQFLRAVPIGGIVECYLSMLAVLWAIIVCIPPQLLYLSGKKREAWVAFAVFAGAHALAGIAYNHYTPQFVATALVMAITVVALVPKPHDLPAKALVALFGLTALVLGIAYFPMLPVLLFPFLLLSVYHGPAVFQKAIAEFARLPRGRQIRWSLLAVVTLAFACMLYAAQTAAFQKILARFLSASTAVSLRQELIYWGSPRPYDKYQLASLFGAFTLHRLPPYSSTAPWQLPTGAVVVGGLLAAAGACVLLTASKPGGPLRRASLSLFVALVPLGAIELFLGQKYEYTQYKALSYFMPFVLLFLVTAVRTSASRTAHLVSRVWMMGLLVLAAGLLAFRLEGARTIGWSHERASTLDIGMPKLIETIQKRDPRPFVLGFNPVPAFSMWEFGLRDVRSIVMQGYRYPKNKEQYLEPDDFEHLWIIRESPPAHPIPGAINIRSFWAYQPLAAAACQAEPVPPGARSPQTVRFAPRSNTSTGEEKAEDMGDDTTRALWFDQDMEYWVFNPVQARRFTVMLKEYDAKATDLTVDLRYPVEAKVKLQVLSQSGADTVAAFEPGALPGDESLKLIVLRIPGRGYSDLTCAQ